LDKTKVGLLEYIARFHELREGPAANRISGQQ
jgi:hypothetical protein